jgi:hypothetical protein
MRASLRVRRQDPRRTRGPDDSGRMGLHHKKAG